MLGDRHFYGFFPKGLFGEKNPGALHDKRQILHSQEGDDFCLGMHKNHRYEVSWTYRANTEELSMTEEA